jgi:hypothetical protein
MFWAATYAAHEQGGSAGRQPPATGCVALGTDDDAAAAEFSDVRRGEAGILGEIARSDSVRVVVSHAYIRGTAAIPDR